MTPTTQAQRVASYRGHEATVLWLSSGKGSKWVHSVGRDGTLKRWPQPRDYKPTSEEVDILAISPDFSLTAHATEVRGANEFTKWLDEHQSAARAVQEIRRTGNEEGLQAAQQRLRELQEKRNTLKSVMPPLYRNIEIRNRGTGEVVGQPLLSADNTARPDLIRFLDDQLVLAVGVKEFRRTVHVWDVASQTQIVRYPLARGERVYHLAYDGDRSWLAFAIGQRIALLKCSAADDNRPVVIPLKNVVALNVSGDELTALTHSGHCLRWTLNGTPALNSEFDLEADKHRWWFVDGDLAVSADESSTWRVWDLKRRIVVHQYVSLFADAVDAVNPDSRTFASGGKGTLRICDLTTGEERLVLPSDGRVLGFRSDGLAVATEKQIWFARGQKDGSPRKTSQSEGR